MLKMKNETRMLERGNQSGEHVSFIWSEQLLLSPRSRSKMSGTCRRVNRNRRQSGGGFFRIDADSSQRLGILGVVIVSKDRSSIKRHFLFLLTVHGASPRYGNDATRFGFSLAARFSHAVARICLASRSVSPRGNCEHNLLENKSRAAA